MLLDLPGVPLVHAVQVLQIAVEDEVGALVVVLKQVVGEDAGELKDAVGEGIEAAHFEVYP